MRVAVRYSVDVDGGFRRALRHRFGEEGESTRAEIAAFFRLYGDTLNDDLRSEHGACCWHDAE